MNEHKCPNCGAVVNKAYKLCNKCKADALELEKRTQRKTDEEILADLETKPRSWRDIFGKVRR